MGALAIVSYLTLLLHLIHADKVVNDAHLSIIVHWTSNKALLRSVYNEDYNKKHPELKKGINFNSFGLFIKCVDDHHNVTLRLFNSTMGLNCSMEAPIVAQCPTNPMKANSIMVHKEGVYALSSLTNDDGIDTEEGGACGREIFLPFIFVPGPHRKFHNLTDEELYADRDSNEEEAYEEFVGTEAPLTTLSSEQDEEVAREIKETLPTGAKDDSKAEPMTSSGRKSRPWMLSLATIFIVAAVVGVVVVAAKKQKAANGVEMQQLTPEYSDEEESV